MAHSSQIWKSGSFPPPVRGEWKISTQQNGTREEEPKQALSFGHYRKFTGGFFLSPSLQKRLFLRDGLFPFFQLEKKFPLSPSPVALFLPHPKGGWSFSYQFSSLAQSKLFHDIEDNKKPFSTMEGHLWTAHCFGQRTGERKAPCFVERCELMDETLFQSCFLPIPTSAKNGRDVALEVEIRQTCSASQNVMVLQGRKMFSNLGIVRTSIY